MKRLLLPALTAALLVGCDGDDPRTALAGNADGSAATPASTSNSATTGTNSPATALALAPESIQPPAAPPALPEAVRDVVRLAQTSVSEGVLVDYINTLKEPYSLGADQIIYLTDLGIPGPAIQALLKHSTGPGTVREEPAPEVAQAPVAAPAATTPMPPQALAAPGAPPAPAGATAAPVVMQAPAAAVTVNTFYDSLSGYGSWTEVPEYGWCWQPSVASVDPGWQPYADNGGWVWTDSGWYWNSYYSWGWAPFHYGRWHRAGFGWCWVPDTYWAPAWVAWRSSDSHCGWAPLPPSARWSAGVGLMWHGRHATFDCDFGLFSDAFIFIGWNRFCDPHPWHHYLPRKDVPPLYALSHSVNHFKEGPRPGGPGHVGGMAGVINHGPGLQPVQAHTSGRIPKVQLNSVASVPTPGAASGIANRTGQPAPSLPVYRPQFATAPTPGSGGGRSTPVPFVPPTRSAVAASSAGIHSPVTPPPASAPLAVTTSERVTSIPTQMTVAARMPVSSPVARNPSLMPSLANQNPSGPAGSHSPLPAYSSGPGAGPNHVLGAPGTGQPEMGPRPTAGPTIVTRPTAQRTLVGTPSAQPTATAPGSQFPERSQGSIAGNAPSTPPPVRRVNPPASLYQGSAPTETPTGPTVVRPGGGYAATVPAPTSGNYGNGRVVYGGGREYVPPANGSATTPSYPGGGPSSYSAPAPAPSQSTYTPPAATARNFTAPATPSFTPPTRSYSAPAPSAPSSSSSGGGSSGNHSGNGGGNNGNKKNP